MRKAVSSTAAGLSDGSGQLKTTSELAADANLGYKIRVLIYDLRNISKDAGSQHRTKHPSKAPESVETAIQKAMANFFEKRKASGDARPCGPHDLAPIYEAVFGIEKEEVQDERFLSRMRRQGLPPIDDDTKLAVAAGPVGNKKKHKKK
ncbi:hypothetical protein PG996_005391 [Apiospora saccharicola]|uniref:Uncharacterized protein n=1 Tax=Apiospora saccharicola TaxID=335842 RepID=A0ABR1VLB5_9PEZI